MNSDRRRETKDLSKLEEEKEELPKESAAERARLHRAKKKKYYEELENQIRDLEKENFILKQENCILKEQLKNRNTPDNNFRNPLIDLIEEEKFEYEILPKMIEENPDQFRFTLYERSRDLVHSYGALRVKVLKAAFRTIINNLIAPRYKVIALIAFHTTPQRLLKLYNKKQAGKVSIYKFKRVPADTLQQVEESSVKHSSSNSEKTLSKDGRNNTSEDIRDQKIEDFLLKYDFSETLTKDWVRTATKITPLYRNLRTYVQNLIKARNKILTTLKAMQDAYFTTDFYK